MNYPLFLVPHPKQIHDRKESFQLPKTCYITVQGFRTSRFFDLVTRLKKAFHPFSLQLELTAVSTGHVDEWLHLQVDPRQIEHPEGYRLHILPTGIHIVGHDEAGVFYGICTLEQICQQVSTPDTFPALQIIDYPDFPNRGVMLDISRDKIPTMETLYDMVDMLSRWKVNQFQLYTEHTFAYRDHRIVWEHSSPMTGEEIMQLEHYCHERFMELVPNQNSFGHLARWLKHDTYKDLAETPDGYTRPWGEVRKEPWSLNPLDERSFSFLEGLFDELLPHFSSSLFNIGCDETWDLGQGKSKQACEERGTGRVYLDFLIRVYQLAKKHDKTVQFWGDIILKYPELLDDLPKDLIALEWGYEKDHPFNDHGKLFQESGIPFYVCPGTSTWNTMGGRTDNAVGNLRNAAENGIVYGAIGFLNTDWGDNGHWQAYPVSFLGYIYGAAVSWGVIENRGLDIQQALNRFAFQDESGKMGSLVYELGNTYTLIQTALRNATEMANLLYNYNKVVDDEVKVEELDTAYEKVMELLPQFESTQMARWDSDWIVWEFRLMARMMAFSLDLTRVKIQEGNRTFDQISSPTRARLKREIADILVEYNRCWLNRNRPGGLEDSTHLLRTLHQLL